jgi:hypothetical protein
MDIFQRSKSLSEREERYLDGTRFNRGDLNVHDDLLFPQNHVALPILESTPSTPESLSFPKQNKNFVNIPGIKLKPRKSFRAWTSVLPTMKENSSLYIPLNLDDCHTESDYFTIKIGSNTESDLVLEEPPLKKSKIALIPRPFKLQRRSDPRPLQSHQDSDTTESIRAQHYSAFLPFEHKIPQPIEEAPEEHAHEDGLHAGRSFLFNKDQVDEFRSPQKTYSPKDRAEPILWDTPPRSVLSLPKPHATRGHDTPYRKQVDASSMNNHHKECNKILSQSPWSAFGTTMRCDTSSQYFTGK